MTRTHGNSISAARPRLGFAGLGWIGAQRMKVLADAGAAEIAVLCDPDRRRLEEARVGQAQGALVCDQYEALLDAEPDGVVIATPNDLHEPQAAAAIQRGIAVFSQKPLAISGAGTRRLLDLARRRGVPLGVDLSYRYLAGVPELKARIENGELGVITAAELCFHNAYGPDASWYYELSRAGGGCLLDLGCHLLDVGHWLLGACEPVEVRGQCLRDGRKLEPPVSEPEDFVMAEVGYASGLRVHLSCSWRASAGRGALITCRVFGTRGGATIRNVGGSFYDFRVELHHGVESRVLGEPPDAWPGRALLDWTRKLTDRTDGGIDLEHLVTTAAVIDRIYGRTSGGP